MGVILIIEGNKVLAPAANKQDPNLSRPSCSVIISEEFNLKPTNGSLMKAKKLFSSPP